MNVSSAVKSLLAGANLKQTDLAEALGMSSKQAVNNKIRKNSWYASDIIKVAELCGGKLVFITPDGQQIVLTQDENKESPDT